MQTHNCEWKLSLTSWKGAYLVDEEIAEYQKLAQIESDIDQQVNEAQKTIKRQIPEYPEEYKAILARLAELEPYIKQVKAITSSVNNLYSIDFPQVEAIRGLLWNKSASEIEYQELSEAKERRERQNSKVTKLRVAAYEAFDAEVKKVKTQTQERLEIQYADSLKRKAELEQLALYRQQKKLQPISTRIRELLDTAIQLDNK